MEAHKTSILNNKLYSNDYKSRETQVFLDFSKACIIETKKKKHEYLSFLNVVRHFEDFQNLYQKELLTNDLNKEVLEDFSTYLQEDAGLSVSTVKGMIQKIKYLLTKAFKKGWAVDDSYEDFKMKSVPIYSTTFCPMDISRIYYYLGLNKTESRIRDILILLCVTSLRYSDIKNLGYHLFEDDFIRMITQKTKSEVYIPINFYILSIFKKYNGDFSWIPSSQYFNNKVKKVCEKIGFTENITYQKVINGKISPISRKKYQLVSSHIGRRSYITNMRKSGKSYEDLRGVTGHASTECMAKSYDKMSNKERARVISMTHI